MQHATRPLKLLLDRLAGVRWAPLAAAVDGVVAGPDLQLAAFSPDPFASLQRDEVPAAGVEEQGTSPRARPQRAAAPGTAARRPWLPPRAGLPASHAAGEAPPDDLPPWRPRAAAPGLPQRVPMPWPALPKARAAAGVPVLAAAAVQALVTRFAPAADTPPLDGARLRALAAPPAMPPRAAVPASAAPAQMPAPPTQLLRSPAMAPAAGVAIPRRPLPEPSAAVEMAQAGRSDAAALPVPHGRASALAELLQRWPGSQAGEAEAPASPADVVPLPVAELTPMPSAPGTPLSFADLPAAFGTDLPRPQAAASDLQFTRALERVLLAEVRRQGLEPDAS